MKIQQDTEASGFSRIDRIVLHLRCLVRDHEYRWHLAGVWREVTLHEKPGFKVLPATSRSDLV